MNRLKIFTKVEKTRVKKGQINLDFALRFRRKKEQGKNSLEHNFSIGLKLRIRIKNLRKVGRIIRI